MIIKNNWTKLQMLKKTKKIWLHRKFKIIMNNQWKTAIYHKYKMYKM